MYKLVTKSQSVAALSRQVSAALTQARCFASQGAHSPAGKWPGAIETERMTPREQRVFDEILQSVVAQKEDGPDTRSRRPDAAVSVARDFIHNYAADRRPYKKPVAGEMAINRYGGNHLAARSALFACETLADLQSFIDSVILGPFLRAEVSLDRMDDPEVREYCRAYPLLITEAMTLFRLAHRDHLAVGTLFRRVKALGVVSQAVGINVSVYNELLLATFEGWRDLDLVEAVLAEMQADGIEPDQHTLTILQHMASTIVRDRETTKGGESYWTTAVRPRQLEHLSRTISQHGKRIASSGTNQARQDRLESYE